MEASILFLQLNCLSNSQNSSNHLAIINKDLCIPKVSISNLKFLLIYSKALFQRPLQTITFKIVMQSQVQLGLSKEKFLSLNLNVTPLNLKILSFPNISKH